jgi:hypothetical protein
MNHSFRDARLSVFRGALIATLGIVGACVVTFEADELAEPNALAAMEKYLARPVVVHQYSALRRLEAAGSGQRGWLDAQTHFAADSGFIYEVTAEGGSGFIRARVLRSLLDEEQQLIARGGSADVAISEDNYEFIPEGVNEEGFAEVRLKPRRKDRSLIIGRMLLTPDEGDLVRVVGRLARNPSFWLTRVNVVRSYERINGVPMPISLETKGQLRFLGSSELRMTYQYSHIDEQPVDAVGNHAPKVNRGSTAPAAAERKSSAVLWPAPLPPDRQRACATHRVVEPLECHEVADLQVVDRRLVLEVGAMEVDFPVVLESDEAMPLSDEELHDATGVDLTSSVGLERLAGALG